MDSGYRYHTVRRIESSGDVETAIRNSMLNYLHDQLGWSMESSEARIGLELNRSIPKSYFDELESKGWNLRGARVLDVGAGQGAALLELLSRGADAMGIEPGPEFAEVARMRLKADGHDSGRLIETPGECLPFSDNSFDYAISLQVLEHVRRPEPILAEIMRVLKPGGQCYIRCENYLSFWEQHYRTRWLPLLPKSIGSFYLRWHSRDPSFLINYVYYTTYPQMLIIANRLGFRDILLEEGWQAVNAQPLQQLSKSVAGIERHVSSIQRLSFLTRWHARNMFKTGIAMQLQKPKGTA